MTRHLSNIKTTLVVALLLLAAASGAFAQRAALKTNVVLGLIHI